MSSKRKKLLITQREAQRLLRIAAAERGIIEMEVDGLTIRFIPACHVNLKRDAKPLAV